MYAYEKHLHGDSAKLSPLKGNSHDRSSAHKPGSTSTLPHLKCRTPSYMGEPPLGRPLVTLRPSHLSPLSVVEFPQLVAKESMWTDGLNTVSSSLAVDLHSTVIELPQELKSTDVNVLKKKTTAQPETEKECKNKCSPRTGIEAFEILAKKRHLAELQFYYLKTFDEGSYRPYDLRVVPRSKAGSDHYIFSPTSVIHVQDGCKTELLTLAGWHREAVLWKALRDIPFIRNFLLHKTFKSWHKSVYKSTFERRRIELQDELLTAVPQFSEALFHFARLFEELQEVHWLPQDEQQTYTLQEFQTTLMKFNQESQDHLQRFFHNRSLVLTKVQETSYKKHQELQNQLEEARLNQRGRALHLQQVSTSNFLKELSQAEQVAQRLGNLAALADCMTIQNLVTISQCEIVAFIRNVLKRDRETQGSLFYAQLTFGADSQLTLFPPMNLFHEVLQEALLSVTNSVLQVSDSYKSCQGSFMHCDYGPSIDLPNTMSTSDCKANTKWVPTKLLSPRLKGHRLRGQFYSLTRKHLEWYLHLQVDALEFEKEPARMAQEALQEIQQMCQSYSWLVDIHFSVSRFSTKSLRSMQGLPAAAYEEQMQKLQCRIDQVRTVPSTFNTSNKLLTVDCTLIRENLESLLRSVEKNVLNVISEVLQLQAKHFLTDLRKAVKSLKFEPAGMSDFTNIASVVEHYEQQSVGMQQQFEDLLTFQRLIEQNDGNMTVKQMMLLNETTNMWNQFVRLLKEVSEAVTQRRSSMIIAMDNTLSLLTKQLEELVQHAATVPYLDPNQSPDQVLAELNVICEQLHQIGAEMNELDKVSKILRGQPLDLTFVTTVQQDLEARKELWDLMASSSAQIQEWTLSSFKTFDVPKAQYRVREWLEQAASLAKVIPSSDEVLQKTRHNTEMFEQQLGVLAKLSSLPQKHRLKKDIIKGMGLDHTPDLNLSNLSMAELLSEELEEHINSITEICSQAQAEADTEQAFRTLQRDWKGMEFRLAQFTGNISAKPQQKPHDDDVSSQTGPQQQLRYSETWTIMGLESLMAQTEDSVMTVSRMLLLTQVSEFKREAEHWVQVLQELDELLEYLQRYQQMWIFLSKMFFKTLDSPKTVQLRQDFAPVDKAFREMIQVIQSDPHVLTFMRLWKKSSYLAEHSLLVLITDGLKVMEKIAAQFKFYLDSLRLVFPRLCFLSDGEMIKILSQQPSPCSLLPLVCKCFRGVQGLDLSSASMRINGVYGSLEEHVAFVPPLQPNLNSVVWLGVLEEKLRQTVRELMTKCLEAQQQTKPKFRILSAKKKDKSNPLNVLESCSHLETISKFPLQCLLVTEEVLWCREIQNIFHHKAQTNWTQIKARNMAKLQSLCKAIQDIIANAPDCSTSIRRTITALSALVLLTMKHSQQVTALVEVKGSLESSFEWQRLLTYHHNATENWSNVSIYVNALGMQLPYGNEYTGPENWMMVNTSSTERAFLGIVLALTSYRCAFVSGPLTSGKQRTALQVGWALGRHVISLECNQNTTWGCVRRMLLGALQTGAWLVLDSVNSMEQRTLSFVGKLLVDIHQCLSNLQNNPEHRIFSPNSMVHKPKMAQTECQIRFEGKLIQAKLSYGCIIVSSHVYSAEIPENLRIATRSVSLTQPNYTMIAEVLLISLGFSEATSISQRLISFFSLAKDSNVLKDFAIGDQYFKLVLLGKVIDSSGIHLGKDKQRENALNKSENTPQELDGGSSLHGRTSRPFIASAVTEEQAVIKGIVSVLLPAFGEHNRTSQFCTILKEVFPAAGSFDCLQQVIEESEHVLRHAVTEELHQSGFWPDPEILRGAVTLHQALTFSQAAVLIGPAGSGKTTLYTALAGALRQLAAKSEKEDASLLSQLHWYSVNTAVLFPNALSLQEFLGGYQDKTGCWFDGAFTKMLRRTEHRDGPVDTQLGGNKKNIKWLVLDGEPLSNPGWFDSLNTLSKPKHPFLCLSSGEKVEPSQESFRILVEATNLKNATPSALARCGLVCISGKDLWEAVWKAELDALNQEDILDQSTLETWSSLAEDLFPSTIIFLRNKALGTVMSNERHEGSHGISDGLQEVMSFIRILHALLGVSGSGRGFRSKQKQKENQELHARNLFAAAYIWGFGGHLHPKHWSQFDLLAREVLLKCRYKIDLPATGTVFEHFLNFDDDKWKAEADSNSAVRLRSGSPQVSNAPVPQYKKYAYLLNLLIEANKPALVVGETGSGKTLFCKSLLEGRPHVNLTVSPLLNSAVLCSLLENQGKPTETLSTAVQHQGLHLFVDDLHEAHYDAQEKISKPLEALRECISKGGVLTSESYHFKLFRSGALGFLGTCSLGSNTTGRDSISPRLTRLFTILSLPSVTLDILVSFHSTQLMQWLQKFPLTPRIADMARSIIIATSDVYYAVSKLVQSADLSPCAIFSLHDLPKVFQGLCLWNPNTTAQQQNLSPSTQKAFGILFHVTRLWAHECFRTFGDCLFSNEERQTLASLLTRVSEKNFGTWLKSRSQVHGNTGMKAIDPTGKQARQTSAPEAALNQPRISAETTSIKPLQLLHKMSSSIHTVVFGPDLENVRMCKTPQQFKHKLLYQERDVDELFQQLAGIVISNEEKKCKYWNPPTFVVYRHRVLQLVHILRALLIPGGHGLLLGSAKNTCRKTTVRLAAHVTGCKLIEVHSGNEGELKELLREAGSQTEAQKLILIHEDISQATRDELLVILATGAIQDMELNKGKLKVCTTLKNSRNCLSMVKKTYVWNRAKNIHVFLLLPLNPNVCDGEPGLSSVSVSNIAKAVKLCCCVEVYQPWHSEDLAEIGSLHLKYSPQIIKTNVKVDTTLMTSVAQVMAVIHQSATKYASTFLNIQPFGPHTYLELIGYIYHLSGHLCKQARGHTSRVSEVLAHLKKMTETAKESTQRVFSLTSDLVAAKETLSKLQKEGDAERVLYEKATQRRLVEEGQLFQLQEQSTGIERRQQKAIRKMTPLYQAAVKALRSINPSDLEEVRRYRQPPDGVVELINAICMLFNRPCNWESGKQLLGQPNFLQELEFFDRSQLNDELFDKLGHIVQSPNFQPHFVRMVSRACESICCWVHAVYQYASLVRNSAPQEVRKKQLKSHMAETRVRLRDVKMKEEATRGRKDETERQQEVVSKNSEELRVELRIAKAQEEDTAVAIRHVNFCAEKWKAAETEIEMNNQAISGDALLLAAAVAYLGPFGPDVRKDLLEKWHKVCLTGKMNICAEDPQISLPDGPQIISTKDPQFVPVAAEVCRVLARAVETDNPLNLAEPSHLILKLLLWALEAPWTHRWPLLADTQAHKMLSTQAKLPTDPLALNDGRSFKEEEYELVVSADDPELLCKISKGAQKGIKILVTQIERAVPSEDLLNMLDRPVGSHRVSHPDQGPQPEHWLFFSTALPARALMAEIHPLILAKVQMIDLSLSTSQIQSLILNDFMQAECLEPWLCHHQMQKMKRELMAKLHLEEASLMEVILEPCDQLLQDSKFLPQVSAWQSASQSLQAHIENEPYEMRNQTPLLNHFRCIAALVADLFKALRDVGHLSPFYFFPLSEFLLAVRGSLGPKKGSDFTSHVDIGSMSMFEISHRMVSRLLAHFGPRLFSNHAELLRLLVCVAFLKHNENCSEMERVTFLRGFSNIEPVEQSLALPSWIPTSTRFAVHLLEKKIPRFQGLASSLMNSSRLWEEYFHFPSATVVGPVPCPSHSHLTILQRAILWKTLCPQWLAAVADDLFVCLQGHPVRSAVMSCPRISAPEALTSFLSRNKGPVIVTLPGRFMDPLLWIKQVAFHEAEQKRVKLTVISFGSKSQADAVLSSLHKAVKTGHWLILNNCHMLDQWDVKVVKKLKQLISSITKACVRMCALHLACDSDWDLAEEIGNSLRHVTSAVIPTKSQNTASVKEHLRRSAVLHSVLMQRQKLTGLGHGSISKWSQEDLLALVDAQVRIAEHCNDPVGTLEYIGAYLIYGCHGSDSETVEAVCKLCLRPPLHTGGRGPHTLTDIISKKGSSDEDLLKDLLQTKPKYPEGVLLGLSAETADQLMKGRSQTLGNLLHEFQGGVAAVWRPLALTGHAKTQEKLQALRDRLELTKESRVVEAEGDLLGPMLTFLQTELEHLAETVSSLLDRFQSLQVISASSAMKLHSISELETRAHLLQRYQAEQADDSPPIYCLSAFANPRGFLAALVRETVHMKQRNISQVGLHFQVLSAADSPVFKPSSGIYLSGLELHGALWNTQLGALQNTLSPKPCPFPLLWVRAQLGNENIVHSTNSASSSSSSLPLFNCPVYLDSQSDDGDLSSSGENIITHVPLASKLSPVICTLKRVRLVSRLKEK